MFSTNRTNLVVSEQNVLWKPILRQMIGVRRDRWSDDLAAEWRNGSLSDDSDRSVKEAIHERLMFDWEDNLSEQHGRQRNIRFARKDHREKLQLCVNNAQCKNVVCTCGRCPLAEATISCDFCSEDVRNQNSASSQL